MKDMREKNGLTYDGMTSVSDAFVGKCHLMVSDVAKSYQELRYTTDLETLRLIFQNQTFRSTSLSAARLNDQKEKQRIGIEPLAKCRYITCFSHEKHESVPFWVSYGLTSKEKKVQLVFQNFASCFKDKVFMDYALIDGGKKLFFNCDEYGSAVNQNGAVGAILGLPPTYTDYNLNTMIDRVSLFDIEYIPTDDPEFTSSYMRNTTVEIGNGAFSGVLLNASTLGRKKSNPWEYEHDTRIMLSIRGMENVGEWIDIRLKDEMFRNLVIIKSPWEDEKLQQDIESIIQNSGLSADVKNSIFIRESDLKGTLNF